MTNEDKIKELQEVVKQLSQSVFNIGINFQTHDLLIRFLADHAKINEEVLEKLKHHIHDSLADSVLNAIEKKSPAVAAHLDTRSIDSVQNSLTPDKKLLDDCRDLLG